MSRHDVTIVGGGISGLSALHYLRRLHSRLDVRLFEGAGRLGGTIGTDRVDGFSFDWGPNGFLDREPLTLELCRDLGLTDELERAGANVANRFIVRGGRLRPVPMSPPKFLTSDILSVRGRLRVLMEHFARARSNGCDESVYDFARRRIGREAADYLVQPMVSGVYGGLAERLSLVSCFPIMRRMEDEYGSLTKAMMAKARQARANGKATGGPGGPGGWLTSFHGGLDTLIHRLGKRYAEFISSDSCATRISRTNGDFTIEFANGKSSSAGDVILAVPSYQAATIIEDLSVELAESLHQIRYAPIAVVALGYRRSDVIHPLDGFGFLVPQREQLRILGSIWTSSIFEDRAPDSCVQFRTMIGGDGDHNSAGLSDDALFELAHTDLTSIVGIKGRPVISRIYRWTRGIPQFAVGHGETMRRIESSLGAVGHLWLTGNAYYGIGLNDCIKQSHKVAQAVAATS